MQFFTSDTHFGHSNIIKYCNRPFSSVEEMDETLIANWNSRVKPTDDVYHLGDFCWHDPLKYLKRLNGIIHFIPGNHDHEALNRKDLFKSIRHLDKIKVGDHTIIMCHFALRVWDASHYGSWHLFGHTHSMLPPWGKSMDVGVDEFNYYPVSFEEVRSIMKNRPETPKPFEDVGPFKEYIWQKLSYVKPDSGASLLLWDGKQEYTGYADNNGVLQVHGESHPNITHWMYRPNPPKE